MIAPPGSDLGLGGGGGVVGGGTVNPGAPPRGPLGAGPSDAPGGTGLAPDGRPIELDKVAPIPNPPRLLKPGDEIHRAIITFTVELIGPALPKPPAEEATPA